MEYNEKHAQLDAKQSQFMNQILGHMKVSYTNDSIHEHGAKPIKVKIDNEEYDFHFDDLTYRYKVLLCTKSLAKIKSKHPHVGSKKTEINFINSDTFWVAPDMLPSSREYFVRVSS